MGSTDIKADADETSLIDKHPQETVLSPSLLARVFCQPSLIYFAAVADHLSIREAARRLNVVSSAVSRQVSQLEETLGMMLFNRDGHRMSLTPAGEILRRQASRVTAPLEAAISELDMLRGLRTGTVRIASVESIGLSFLPSLLADFGRRYPRLHLDVSITSSANVIAGLMEERFDVGFGFLVNDSPHIEQGVRRDVPIGVLMRPDHPLAQVPRLTLSACLPYPIALGKKELSIREVIEPFLMRSTNVLPPFLEVDSIRILVDVALQGHHASIMTPIGAHKEIADGALVFRPLQDPGLPTNRFGLMVKAGGGLHFAPAVFYEHARQHFNTLELPGAI
ncbi:transcriptional regulator [Labrys miyagiensis]|uniref:Transcriptional regulator n=1 Tax=Labrys miyagiensis TaxID=346912 RepID=A0ABQ6CME7_9HYPH|nr:LysR family transcriptional regulator [Labrys miyagiensis]GLS19431.1 transcriptional regulator [Labrys miyagiensis]